MPARTAPAACLLFFSALLAWTPHRKNPDIYVLGVIDNTVTWWKSGVANTITDTGTADRTIADYLSVSGNDVYIAGTTFHDQATVIPRTTVKYWKNGIPIVLKDSTGHARAGALFVSGNDVYVAGTLQYDYRSHPQYSGPAGDTLNSGTIATCWKNGTPVALPGVGRFYRENGKVRSSYFDYICSIFVAGKDVYVGGGSNEHVYGDTSTYHFVRYWKNGTATDLLNGIVNFDTTFNFPNASSMSFSGNDVYVAGYENFHGSMRAIYCKNGHWSYLPASGNFSLANSLLVSGSGDVYIAGTDVCKGSSRAVYWKNGVEIPLTDGTVDAAALSVCIYGSDVYVAGYEQKDNTSYATYWKNGVAVHLGKKGRARAIVVQ